MPSSLHDVARSACNEIGVIFQAVPADGKFHQLDAEGKATRNGAGRIKMFSDGEGGQVWNHATDDTRLFWVKNNQTLTPSELEDRKRRTKEERDRAERELADARQKAAKLAVEVWKVSKPPVDPPYLLRKQVETTGTLREIMLDALSKIIGPITEKQVLV